MAQELQRADRDDAVLIVGRDGGVAEELVRAAGVPLRTLRIAGLHLGNPVSVMRFAAQLPPAIAAARDAIRDFGADVVVGAAGYVSVPVVIAARRDRIPVVLLEQNALPGRATRLLASRASAVAASFAETAQHLHGARVVHTGNPLRAEVMAQLPAELHGERCGHLLVMGGSQGARTINRAVQSCIRALLSGDPELRVTHQCGRLDHDELMAAHRALPAELGERWTVAPFFDEMGARIAAADLVLMRAGGSSLAECSALGRPMILVPYPHAGDHQRHNARPFVEAGAAALIADESCDGERVLREVRAVIDDPAHWRTMAAASRAMGRPRAAHDVVRLLDTVVARRTVAA